MATMERPSRIVRCPKCLALLQEPPPGTPLYKCGNCSTVLRAKHASSDSPGARRVPDRAQRQTRATPPAHADSNDGRKLPSKPMPPDHMSRHDDPRSGTANIRPTPADAGKKLPSHAHHSSFSPGPLPPKHVPNNTNADYDIRYRPRDDLQRLSSPDNFANRVESLTLRGREGPGNVPQTKATSPARIEEVYIDPVVEVDRFKPPPADPASEAVNYRERERRGEPEDEDDTPFSPSKALAAIQNAGPLYKVKEWQKPGLGLTNKFSTRSSLEGPSRGRNKSQGDEFLGPKHTHFVYEQNMDGLRHHTVERGPCTGRSREEKPGVHRRQHSDGVAISERPLSNDIYNGHPGLHTGMRQNLVDQVRGTDKCPVESYSMHPVSQNERNVLHPMEATVEKQKSRDDSLNAREGEVTETRDLKPIARASSSDVVRHLNETSNGSSSKEITSEQDLAPVGDISLAKWRQLKELDMKGLHKEKPIVNKDSFDDDPEPGALLDEEEQFATQSPQTGRKPLSPPRNVVMSPPSSFHKSRPVFGAVQPQPEHLLKAQARSRQGSDTPSIPQDLYGNPDVLDYDTSDDSSNTDDADPYQITSKPHSEELKSPTLSHEGPGFQANEIGDDNERSRNEDEQDTSPLDLSSKGHQEAVGSFDPVVSGASPHFSHGSPESSHNASPSQVQTYDQGTSTRPSDPHETSNSFSFGQGGEVRGSAYSLLKGQTQKIRLQINTAVPERIHVRCRHCELQLEVPVNLPRSQTGVQRLRCGSCWKISRFRLNHLLSPCRSPSPDGSDNSPESSFRLGSNSSDGTSGRYSGTRSNRETGSQDRVIIRTQSGASLPVPPTARHNPRAASGSKLANMVSGSSLPTETSNASTPNTSGDLGPGVNTSQVGKENVDMLLVGQAEPSGTLHSPTLSSTSQDMGTSRQQKASPDRRLLQSSSDSDEEKASAQLKIGPSALPPRMSAWPAPETPEFDDGQEFKGLKGFLKKSVKELTKGKKSTQYRRKVVVNGHAVPDDVVKRAEEYAGSIHPGSYWYDIRAGFWGVMGGPCLGMIPPFIEELNYTLARHCSHGKTGVLVNGRELHHKDLELLKRRGLPGTPGKAYNVDIDGRLTDEATGIELKGLGRLAPTLEQTGRGPGMWVPESQRGL